MELERLQVARTLPTLAGLACAVLAVACERQGPGSPASNTERARADEPGYRAPPDVISVAPIGQEALELAGVAAPRVTVRLAAPSGAAGFATADSAGRWRIRIPSAAGPRLFGLSMSDGGRIVQAPGYLFIAPDGSTAKLKAGGGSQLLATSTTGVGDLVVDYDTQRAATFSGSAAPNASLSLRVDGVERGQSVADAAGQFVIPLNQPLSLGAHDFDLIGVGVEVEAPVMIGAPIRLARYPFAATRLGSGWRIDWLTPGGGEQSTLILGPPAARG